MSRYLATRVAQGILLLFIRGAALHVDLAMPTINQQVGAWFTLGTQTRDTIFTVI